MCHRIQHPRPPFSAELGHEVFPGRNQVAKPLSPDRGHICAMCTQCTLADLSAPTSCFLSRFENSRNAVDKVLGLCCGSLSDSQVHELSHEVELKMYTAFPVSAGNFLEVLCRSSPSLAFVLSEKGAPAFPSTTETLPGFPQGMWGGGDESLVGRRLSLVKSALQLLKARAGP